MTCDLLFLNPGPLGITSLIAEEQMTTMSPTAATVSKIKPGMKLTEVRETPTLLYYDPL